MMPFASRGQPGAPHALRYWYRSVTLQEYGSPRRWPAGAAMVLGRPFVHALRTVREVRRWGPGVREGHGVGLLRQGVLLWLDRMRFAVNARDFYRNQLYLREHRGRLATLIPGRVNWRLLVSIRQGADREKAETIENKERYDEWCRANGFPHPETVAVISGAHAPDPDSLPRCDLFSKVSYGSGGKGAALWRWDGEGRWIGDDERPYDARALLDRLRGQAGDRKLVLLQKRLRNHPSLDPIAPRALVTARMLTFRWPDGRLVHGCTILRIPVGNSPVDNMSAGGMGARVETATGTVREARLPDPVASTEPLLVHPTTGARIDGLRLPWWAEARALVERAHRTLGGLAIVGWDVGLTPDGPVLVESNSRPGLDVSQLYPDGPRVLNDYGLCVASHYASGRHFEAWRSRADRAGSVPLPAAPDEPADLASRAG